MHSLCLPFIFVFLIVFKYPWSLREFGFICPCYNLNGRIPFELFVFDIVVNLDSSTSLVLHFSTSTLHACWISSLYGKSESICWWKFGYCNYYVLLSFICKALAFATYDVVHDSVLVIYVFWRMWQVTKYLSDVCIFFTCRLVWFLIEG